MAIEILLIALLALLATVVGTVSGFGTSTIMVPVLLFFFPLPETLLFVGIVHLFGDIWKMALFKQGIQWKFILAFGIPGVIFSVLGATLSFQIPEVLLSQMLGAFLFIYVLYLFFNPKWKIPKNLSASITGGTLSGFFAGIFGVGGAIRGSFLAAFNLPKALYIFTSGAIAFFIDSGRIITYISGGTRLEEFLVWALVLSIPVSYVGAYTGKRIVTHIPQKQFRVVVAVFLGVVALKFLFFR